MSCTGRIFAIKRFEIHDGDGIRTTLFLKGCPLKCKWCHNPEGINWQPEMSYYQSKCIVCGECAKVCSAHRITTAGHVFLRDNCIGCGKCDKVCLGGALKFYGEAVTPEDVLPYLIEDLDFFKASGGGVTLSGGEPMLQYEFAEAVFRLLKKNGVHTALDTCGFASWEAYQKVLPWVDLVLFDIKAADADVHVACTGQTNDLILSNLRKIDSVGKTIDVRIPYVPGMNDNQVRKIGDILLQLKSIRKVNVLPYHNYSSSKYASLNMQYAISSSLVRIPSDDEIASAVELLIGMGISATDQTGDPK